MRSQSLQHRVRALARLLPFFAFACAGAPPPAPPPVAIVVPSDLPAVRTALPVVASAPPPVASAAPPPTNPLPVTSPFSFPSATPGPGEVTLDSVSTPIDDAWLEAHKFRQGAINCALGCATLTIAGPEGELVMGSEVGIDDGGGETTRSIYLVQRGASRRVFTAVESEVADPDGMTVGPHMAKGVTLFVRDGRDLVVAAAGDSCSAKPGVGATFDARVAAMCRAVGVYRWNGVSFGRVPDVRKGK